MSSQRALDRLPDRDLQAPLRKEARPGVALRVAAGRRRPGPRFSDAALLDGLRRVALTLGWVPNDAEYDHLAAGMGLASSTTIRQRFASWPLALQAAGLEPPPRRRWALRWDQAECWRALESVSDQLPDPPRYRSYLQLAKGRDDLPSGGVVLHRLGLWSQIAAELTRRKAAGRKGSASARQGSGNVRRPAEIRPRVSLPPRPTKAFSDQRLIEGIRAVGESAGHTPRCGDYKRLAKPLGLASFSTVCIRFGSWSAAVQAAGFERAAPNRTHRSRWDERACWEALDRVADELGDFPRYSHYNQLASGRDDLPSGAMLRQRLGPWSQIAAALGQRRGTEVIPEVAHAAA